MAEEVAVQAGEGAQTPAPEATTQTDAQSTQAAGGQQAGAPAAGKTYTEAEVSELVKDRLLRQERKLADAAVKEREAADRKAQEEQGKFKELYEGLQKQLAEEQARAQRLEHESLRRQAAEETGLPVKLAGRLQGETLDDLKADAKELLASMPKPAPPNINANSGSAAPPSTPFADEQERKRLASIYGVSAKNFGKTQ